jgi:hypothetical protein
MNAKNPKAITTRPMSICEILRKHPAQHVGYMPRNAGTTTFNPAGICPELKRIPSKIAAYFHRDKIKRLWKSNHCGNPLDNYYIIEATDGTLFHVEY